VKKKTLDLPVPLVMPTLQTKNMLKGRDDGRLVH
jgi:hypothetical protein